MPRFYHINHDRHVFKTGNFQAGDILTLTTPFRGPSSPPPADVEYWKEHTADWNTIFPDGLSFWGRMVLLNIVADPFMLQREYRCEELRQQCFPHRPSRLQSFFCCESLEDARKYRHGFDRPEALIWEVEHETGGFRADMILMRRCSEASLDANIMAYWQGKTTDDPLWEVLLIPPVQIIECVDPEPVA